MFGIIRQAIDKILQRGATPTKPARSVFGPDADHELAERSKQNNWDLELEKNRHRRPGL